MADPIPLHKPRKGALATPEKVFPACNELFDEVGWGFKVSDVIAKIGGGSNTTLGPIIAMWRHYKPLFQATQALDDTSGIEIAQAVDKLLGAKTLQVDTALEKFMEGAGTQITELAGALEQSEEKLDKAHSDNEALQGRIEVLEAEAARAAAALESKTRALDERNAQLELKSEELKNAQASHAAKLEQLASHHKHEISTELETQRRRMEEERSAAIESLRAHHQERVDQERADANAMLQRAEAKVTKLEDRLEVVHKDKQSLAQQLAVANAEGQSAQREADAAIARLEASLNEKQQAIDEAQDAHDQVLSAIREQLSTNSGTVNEQLLSVAGAADSVHEALAEIRTLVADFRGDKTHSRSGGAPHGTD